MESLKLLQTTNSNVELVVSQLLHTPQEPQMKLNCKDDCIVPKEQFERKPHNNFDYLREMKYKEIDDIPSINSQEENIKREPLITNNGVLSKSAPDLPKVCLKLQLSVLQSIDFSTMGCN